MSLVAHVASNVFGPALHSPLAAQSSPVATDRLCRQITHLALGERLRLVLRYPLATLVPSTFPSLAGGNASLTLGHFLATSGLGLVAPGQTAPSLLSEEATALVTGAVLNRVSRLWRLFCASSRMQFSVTTPPLPETGRPSVPDLPEWLPVRQLIHDLSLVASPEVALPGLRLATCVISQAAARGNWNESLELTQQLWLATHLQFLRQRQLEMTAHLLEMPQITPAASSSAHPGQWYRAMACRGEALLQHLTMTIHQLPPTPGLRLEGVFSPAELRREARLRQTIGQHMDQSLHELDAAGCSPALAPTHLPYDPFAEQLEFEILTTRFFLTAARHSAEQIAFFAHHCRPAVADMLAQTQAATHPDTAARYAAFIQRHGARWLQVWLLGCFGWLT